MTAEPAPSLPRAAPSPEAPVARRGAQQPFAPLDYALYAITVVAWSLSWYALAVQTRGEVSIEMSLVYRFLIAAAIMFAWAALAGHPLRFSWRRHALFLGMGVCIFSMNFNLFYHASAHLVSGLLAVVFSLASVINIALAWALSRERPSAGVLLGAGLGLTGIALLFAPTLAAQAGALDRGALLGLALCVVGTTLFSTGNLLSARLQRERVPVVGASAWGMLYGALVSLVLALLSGEAVTFDASADYVVSLLWLAVVSTVAAFASYLTLIGRVGAGRAGYATVVFPVFALLVSTLVEGYAWTIPAALGLVLVLTGNVFVVRGR